MREDEDYAGTCESISDVDKTDESDDSAYLYYCIYYNLLFITDKSECLCYICIDITDKSLVHKNSGDSETMKNQTLIPKTGSTYAIVNGSIVNLDAENTGDNMVTIASADVGLPRSETIAAIGHRPCAGNLEPVRVFREKSVTKTENEEKDESTEFCKKCGHYSKRQ